MVIRYRRISKTIELRKLIHIVPYTFIISMKNMRTIFVNIDSFNLFCIHIPAILGRLSITSTLFPAFSSHVQ